MKKNVLAFVLIAACPVWGFAGTSKHRNAKSKKMQVQRKKPAVAVPQESAPTEPGKIVLSNEEEQLLAMIVATQVEVKIEGKTRQSAVDPKPMATAKLQDLYSQAVRYPNLMKVLLARLQLDYVLNQANARSAPQASQVANEGTVDLLFIIAAQNQRLIELAQGMKK